VLEQAGADETAAENEPDSLVEAAELSAKAVPIVLPLLASPSAERVTEIAPMLVAHKPRVVLRSAVAAWSKPGLCTSVGEATATRETLASSFRLLDLGERGSLYVDPRLPTDAELPVLESLAQAETEVRTRLGLQPPRPRTFIYSDQQLMKASACINEDVVAFYDGALHIIAGRSDALASVLHEYAHHALFSAGVMAPTWAHEGIAMSIAKERWWREGRFLRALSDNPFAMDDMDRAIAYKLKPEQAVAFYVQSAALVECVMLARHWSLRELFTALSGGTSTDSVTYDLPELERPSFLGACIGQGLATLSPGR